jgi:hypothetical protein
MLKQTVGHCVPLLPFPSFSPLTVTFPKLSVFCVHYTRALNHYYHALTRTHIYMRAFMHTHERAHTHTHTRTYIITYTHIHAYTHTYIHIYKHTYAHIHTHAHTHTHTHTYVQTYVRMYIYAYTFHIIPGRYSMTESLMDMLEKICPIKWRFCSTGESFELCQ